MFFIEKHAEFQLVDSSVSKTFEVTVSDDYGLTQTKVRDSNTDYNVQERALQPNGDILVEIQTVNGSSLWQGTNNGLAVDDCPKQIPTNKCLILGGVPTVNIISEGSQRYCTGEPVCFRIGANTFYQGNSEPPLPTKLGVLVRFNGQPDIYLPLNLKTSSGYYEAIHCLNLPPDAGTYTLTVELRNGPNIAFARGCGIYFDDGSSYAYQAGSVLSSATKSLVVVNSDAIGICDGCGSFTAGNGLYAAEKMYLGRNSILNDCFNNPPSCDEANIWITSNYKKYFVGGSFVNIKAYSGNDVVRVFEPSGGNANSGFTQFFISECLEQFREYAEERVTDAITDNDISLETRPNPFNGLLSIGCMIPKNMTETGTMSIYDMAGKRVALVSSARYTL